VASTPIDEKAKTQWDAAWALLTRAERFAIKQFLFWADADIGAVILGIDDEDGEMSADARRAYEVTVFGY
jgi:hypothetical protein